MRIWSVSWQALARVRQPFACQARPSASFLHSASMLWQTSAVWLSQKARGSASAHGALFPDNNIVTTDFLDAEFGGQERVLCHAKLRLATELPQVPGYASLSWRAIKFGAFARSPLQAFGNWAQCCHGPSCAGLRRRVLAQQHDAEPSAWRCSLALLLAMPLPLLGMALLGPQAEPWQERVMTAKLCPVASSPLAPSQQSCPCRIQPQALAAGSRASKLRWPKEGETSPTDVALVKQSPRLQIVTGLHFSGEQPSRSCLAEASGARYRQMPRIAAPSSKQ